MSTGRKMILALVPRVEAERVVAALVAAGDTATTLDSRGGVLRQAQKALLIAVEQERLEAVLGIIRQNCRHKVAVSSVEDRPEPGSQPVTAELGGAIVFVWSIERIESY